MIGEAIDASCVRSSICEEAFLAIIATARSKDRRA
jgi:hypothetical protein